ncbi:MAG: family 78 glycoside hydrolase catalytic domain [Prevotella sp.]|nr:family 78 glycoside hydrolase catalytic domain [Prevotella sp.]
MKHLLSIMSLALLSINSVNALEVNHLRTQAMQNPVGIDITTPLFSWVLESDVRGTIQQSYAISVASDADMQNIVWQSGTVVSDQSVDVAATGLILQPRTRYYWQVTVADNNGQTASSEEVALFETGLLQPSGWGSTQWIKATTSPRGSSTTGSTELKDYEVEVKFQIKSIAAGLIFAAKDHNNYYMWQVNTNTGQARFRPHQWTNGNPACLEEKPITAVSVKNGEDHVLRIEVTDARVTKTYIDGQLIDTRNGDFSYGTFGFREDFDNGNQPEEAWFDDFRVTASGGVLLSEDFESGETFFTNGTIEGGRYFVKGPGTYSWTQGGCPVFRKVFELKAGISRARLYASGLGIYNNYINGQRVGQIDADGTVWYDELKPGSTDMRSTVFYTTHDVTPLLHEGQNAIGAEVSSGWWNGGIAHGEWGNKDCAVRAMLIVTYDDGSEEVICTDQSWLSNTNGPLRMGDIYNGETYDARRTLAWTTAGFNDADWYGVAQSNDFTGTIRAFEGPAVRAVKALERQPLDIHVYEGVTSNGTAHGMLTEVEHYSGQHAVKLKAGQTAIYDLGQNAAGWVSFTACGAEGTHLRFRFSEMINENGDANRGNDGPGGSLYLIALRSAKATLDYTMRGDEKGESFHPTSTYYGFRYVEVTTSADVEISSLVGETVTSAVSERSSFTTSHATVNQLYRNILWGQRSNFVSVPTDCPQRDERLGWTADTQIYSMAGLYNGDTRNFYKKWMRDMRESQNPNGAYPHVAPYSWGVGYGAAVWADAGIVLPYNVYLMTGDKGILTDNFASMERYMDFLATQTGDGYLYNGGTTTYGDWVSFVPTDSRYISVCYYAYDALLMKRMCEALGDSEKAAKYQTLYENICKEWQSRYLSTSMIPKITTQCGFLLPLRFGMLPSDESYRRTVESLRRSISGNKYTLNTGFVGTGLLNQTLTQVGLNNEAYTLLLQRNCPSWLYTVDQGATTMWERWNSYTKEGGFHQDISMNSFNHYAYGAVAEWMFRDMAGIAPVDSMPGFKHFLLQPTPDTRTTLLYDQERITDVDAVYWSEYGAIKAAWNCDGGNDFTYSVTIPANTTATLVMPCAEGCEVMEGSTPAAEAQGVQLVGQGNGSVVYRVSSGSYVFSTKQEHTAIREPKDASQRAFGNVPVYDLLGRLYPSAVQDGLYIHGNRKEIVKRAD